jgi:hypothetical protein
MITLPFGPFPIPSLWFSGSFEKKQFRSMTLTKVVQRFGLLERTIASDVGSYVETENLAYEPNLANRYLRVLLPISKMRFTT